MSSAGTTQLINQKVMREQQFSSEVQKLHVVVVYFSSTAYDTDVTKIKAWPRFLTY